MYKKTNKIVETVEEKIVFIKKLRQMKLPIFWEMNSLQKLPNVYTDTHKTKEDANEKSARNERKTFRCGL